MTSQKDDLNARGAFLHMAADAAVALVLAAVAIMATGWHWLDPAVAIAVSVLIAWTAWDLLRDALRLELDGVPPAIDAPVGCARSRLLGGVPHDRPLQPDLRAVRDCQCPCHITARRA